MAAKNNLSVLKKQGYGVVLTGSEKDYREAMRRFISETTSAEDFKDLHDGQEALTKAVMNVTDKGIYKLLNSHTIQRVYTVLQKLHEEKSPTSQMPPKSVWSSILPSPSNAWPADNCRKNLLSRQPSRMMKTVPWHDAS